MADTTNDDDQVRLELIEAQRCEIERLRRRKARQFDVAVGHKNAEIEWLRAALGRIAGGDGYYPDYARAVLYGNRPVGPLDDAALTDRPAEGTK